MNYKTINIEEIEINNFPRIVDLTLDEHNKLINNLCDVQIHIIPIYKKNNIYYSLLDDVIFEIYKSNFNELICMDHGEINDTQAKLIYLRSLFFIRNFDSIGVSKIISDICEFYDDNHLINTLPFDSKYIDMFKNLFNFDWDDFKHKKDDVFNFVIED